MEFGERYRGGDQLAGALGELADRKRRAGADGAGEEVDLGDLEQLLRLLHRHRGIGFFVLVQQLDRTSHDAAGGVDLLDGEIEAPPHLLSDPGIGAAERRHHADLDRVGGANAGDRGRREQRSKRRCLECFHHVLPGFVWVVMLHREVAASQRPSPARTPRPGLWCGRSATDPPDALAIVGSTRCHSGARRRREPGIHNHRRWLWIPGSLATLGPRNDDRVLSAIPTARIIVQQRPWAANPHRSTAERAWRRAGSTAPRTGAPRPACPPAAHPPSCRRGRCPRAG